MSEHIQIRSDTAEIRIGDLVVPLEHVEGESLRLLGQFVRAITLRERDHVMSLAAFAGGAGPTGRDVASLIAKVALATPSGTSVGSPTAARDAAASSTANSRGPLATLSGGAVHLSPGAVDTALEAVALHLAGASLVGSLQTTSLLVSRAAGRTGLHCGLTATEADRIAMALAETLLTDPGQSDEVRSADDAWTTIRYGNESPEAPGQAQTATGKFGQLPDPESSLLRIRDALAANLLARDAEPIDAHLAATLVMPAEPDEFHPVASIERARPRRGPTAFKDQFGGAEDRHKAPTAEATAYAAGTADVVDPSWPTSAGAPSGGEEPARSKPVERLGEPGRRDVTQPDVDISARDSNEWDSPGTSRFSPQPGSRWATRSKPAHAPDYPEIPEKAGSESGGFMSARSGAVGRRSKHSLRPVGTRPAHPGSVEAVPLAPPSSKLWGRASKLPTAFGAPDAESGSPKPSAEAGPAGAVHDPTSVLAEALERAADRRGVPR